MAKRCHCNRGSRGHWVGGPPPSQTRIAATKQGTGDVRTRNFKASYATKVTVKKKDTRKNVTTQKLTWKQAGKTALHYALIGIVTVLAAPAPQLRAFEAFFFLKTQRVFFVFVDRHHIGQRGRKCGRSSRDRRVTSPPNSCHEPGARRARDGLGARIEFALCEALRCAHGFLHGLAYDRHDRGAPRAPILFGLCIRSCLRTRRVALKKLHRSDWHTGWSNCACARVAAPKVRKRPSTHAVQLQGAPGRGVRAID